MLKRGAKRLSTADKSIVARLAKNDINKARRYSILNKNIIKMLSTKITPASIKIKILEFCESRNSAMGHVIKFIKKT